MHSTLSNSLALYHPCLHFPNSRSLNPSSLTPYPLNWSLYTLLDPTNFSYVRLPQRPSVKESGILAWLPASVRWFKLFCLYSRPFMIWPQTSSPFSSSRLLPTSLALRLYLLFSPDTIRWPMCPLLLGICSFWWNAIPNPNRVFCLFVFSFS